MKFISTKYRSSQSEIMDSFEFQGEKLEKVLADLERVNLLLGGNRVTINALEKLKLSKNKEIHLADIGCGSGQMLREIAKWGRKKNLNLILTGIDANEHSIIIARKKSIDFPEISYKTQNIFSKEFKELNYDLVSISLTLHHFSKEQIKELLQNLVGNTRFAIIINDLQRSKTAYYLFWLFCLVFVRSHIAKTDGLISILRGFKRDELLKISEEIELKNFKLKWCWAFRYQWIVRTNEQGRL